MAGLLDSDWVKFLAAPRAYYRDKQMQQGAEQFKGLLGGLEQQGPVQPGGLLESRAPDQQFWLKAAAIPGYEGLAGQQLGYEAAGNQAMARQQQQQGFESNFLTKAQQIQLELQQRRDQVAADVGLGGLAANWARTNASVGASGAAAQNSQMGALLKGLQIQGEQKKQATENGPLFNQLPPTERMKVVQGQLRNDAAVNSTQEVLDYVLNRDPSAPLRAIGTARGGAMAADWSLSAIPVMKDMVGAGALDDSERKWFENIIQNPSDLHLTENAENQFKLIAQKVIDYRDQSYQAVGLPVPTTKGRGAVSRSQGAQPKGALKPYTPGSQ